MSGKPHLPPHRPFVEFLSAPFWGGLADRWQKGKLLLLASLSAWIVFTVPLGSVQPPATSCYVVQNHTAMLRTPEVADRVVRKRSVEYASVPSEEYR